MKKYITVVLSSLLIIAMLFIVSGCDDPNTSEINQYDYFDEYVGYSLYDYIEDNKDWSKQVITNSAGEVQQNCYKTLTSLDNNVSIKDISSHSDYRNYFTIHIYRAENAKSIVLSKLSLQIFSEADCEMCFSLRIGEVKPRATKTITVAANTATELIFESFAEYTWTENSKAAITITLENAASVGTTRYGFNDLELSLKNND